MKIIPTSWRRAAINFCRGKFARSAVRRRRAYPLQDQPVSLHMVVGHEMLLMGQLALRSLEFHTRRCWAPIVHDDGTLTDADCAELLSLFPDATVVRRAEADRALFEALAAYPACQQNRVKHHWFLKVFDTRHYARHDHYIVLDSDIIFFRRPDLLLRWVREQPDAFWLMEDTREKYALAREDIEKALGLRMWKRVNSGLDLMYRPQTTLELAEVLLEKCAPMAREYQFLEQTYFAVVASAWNKGGLFPREYEISWTNLRRPDAICRHYVGPFKNDALFIEGATSFWWQSL